MTKVAEAAPKQREAPLRGAMSLPHLWAVVAVVLPVIATMGSLGTIDLAYHIRAGELMLHTHSVVRTDTFSITAAGRPWLNQQWGAQLLFAAVFRVLGWPGMALLQAVLVGIVFAFVYLACRAAGAEPRYASLFSLAAFAVAFRTLTLRPELLGTVLFAVSLWIVAGRRRHPGRLWAMPAVVALCANVHGSFVLGPLLLALGWIEDRFERFPGSGRTLAVGVWSVAATVLNPFGLRVWPYAVGISTNGVITRLVSEWQPPSVRRWDDAIFFLSVAAVIALLARRARPAPWPSLLSLGVFFLIALTATRNTLWWGLAAAPVMASVLRIHPRPVEARLPPSLLNTAIAGALILVMGAFYVISLQGGSWHSPGDKVADAPRGITADLKRLLRPGDRMFNAQRWGSWFELALPRNRVFVDSRIELYPLSVWNDYLNVSAGRQGWQTVLDRWRVAVVVADRGQQASLIPLIGRDPAWRLAYRDKTGSIFVRSS